MTYDKYRLYEHAVQSAEEQVDFFIQAYKDLNGKNSSPGLLREDFCGTFLHCCEWVKKGPRFKAMGVDLDSTPLKYGKKNHLAELARDAQKRIRLLKKNVMSVTSPKADVIAGCNFSFNALKKWEDLKHYFECTRRSLKPNGIHVLEFACGPGMIEKEKEHRRYQKDGKFWFQYVWDQKSFEPIHQTGQYAIHFKLANGKWKHDAFTYDWRLWSIPEIRMAMELAGFEKTVVYWESEDKNGEGTGEYVIHDKAPNEYTWMGYVVGQAKPRES